MLAWQVASAASSTPLEAPGSWRGGTVLVTAADAGRAVITVVDAAPGPVHQRCVAVTYDGDVAARVGLVVPDLAGALGPHLSWTVTEGTGGDPSCAGFTPLPGLAPYSGTLGAFAAVHGDGASGWGALAPTGGGQQRVYRVTWSVDDAAAQGAGAAFSLRWVARSA